MVYIYEPSPPPTHSRAELKLDKVLGVLKRALALLDSTSARTRKRQECAQHRCAIHTILTILHTQ